MRRSFVTLPGAFALVLLGALAGAACRRTEAPPPARPASLRATLVAVKGDVRIKRAAANEYAAAARGAALGVDDRVETGAAGHATLLFDDGTTAVMTPRSLVSIEPAAAAGGRGALQVRSGRVDVDIVADSENQFHLRTAEAEASLPAREITVVGGGGGGGKPGGR